MEYKPITLVHLITELNVGGAEQMLFKLLSLLDKKKFRCIVISMTDEGFVGEKIIESGIKLFTLGMRLGRPTIRGFMSLCYLLKKESVDILQTWLYHADLLGLVAGKISGVKNIVWNIRCSDMELRNYNFLTTLVVRANSLLSPIPDAIIVNSVEGKKIHEKLGYNLKKTFIIPNGFDTDIFIPDESAKERLLHQLELPENSILIGLVARFDPMKDHENFLKAASIASAHNNRLHFVLVGEGVNINNRDLMSSIQKKGLLGKISLLGLRFDINSIVPAFDIAVSSSSYGEGFSNAIGEAMACGVPCVVTDIGDSALIVADTGKVVPPRSPNQFAEALLEMIAIPEARRKKLGMEGRTRIKSLFSIDKIAFQYENLYLKFAEAKGIMP